MVRFLRLLLALALMPLAWGVTCTFADVFRLIPVPEGAIVAPGLLAVLAGMAAFLAAWILLPAPVRLYVLGHELTHAVWALAFGARVSRLKVGVAGGSVAVSKSNVWITLAPYFFPFWTILVAVAALIVRCFTSPLPWPHAWLFAIGFTWCFHLCFTLRSLMQRQPDIQEYGRVFSYVLIWLFNVAGVIAWIVCTSETRWKTVWEHLWGHTAAAYGAVYGALSWLADMIARRMT